MKMCIILPLSHFFFCFSFYFAHVESLVACHFTAPSIILAYSVPKTPIS